MPFSARHQELLSSLIIERGEPIFVLRGRDPSSVKLVLAWLGKNLQTRENRALKRASGIAIEMGEYFGRCHGSSEAILVACAGPDAANAENSHLKNLAPRHQEVFSTLGLNDDEPIFVLRGGDMHSGEILLQWAAEKAAIASMQSKVKYAIDLAIEMRAFPKRMFPHA